MKKWYERFRKEESGDIAIEALFGLIIFILSVMAVLMFSMLMRLEASTQYAVDQVAKEISQYYYIVEKAGLLPDEPVVADVDDTNALIGDFDDLVEKGNTAINDFGAFFESGSDAAQLETLVENVESMQSNTESIYQTISGGNWGSQVKNILTLTLKSGTDRLFGQYIAGPICKMLFPKYLPTSDPDAYFKSYGIENGMDDMYFGCSTFIADGYTINVVLDYTINLKALTFGIFDKDVHVRQVGSTSAWVYYYNSENNQQNTLTLWDIEGDFPRGKAIVAHMEEKGSFGKEIEGSRIGYDTYDSGNKMMTEFHTIDLYETKVTERQEDGTYTIDKAKLKARMRDYCNKALNNIPKTKSGTVITVDGQQITLDGTEKHQVVIVLPEEAQADFQKEVNEVKADLAADFNPENLEIQVVYEMKGKPQKVETK